MPYRLDEEQQQKLDSTAAPPMISGVSTGVDVNVPSGGAKQQAQAQGPQKSGQYQNIQQYLAANQPQAAEMAGKVAGGVEQKVGEAQAAGTALQAEPPKVGEYKPQDILAKAQAGTATEAEKQAYQQQKTTGGYTGPSDVTGLKGYGEYFKKGEAAQTAAQQAGTESGQRELLKQTFQRPNYTQGATTLDQALLSQSQAGQQTLANLQQKYSGLGNVLKGYETGAAGNIAAAQQQAQQNIAAFKPAEQQAQQAIMAPIQQRVGEAQQQAGQWQQYQKDVADANLKAETLAATGLKAGENLWGLNLQSYMNPELSPATAQNIATQEERQKYNNLMNFLGSNTQELAMGGPTYQKAGFDIDRFRQDQAAKEAEFNKYWNEGSRGAANYLATQRSGTSDGVTVDYGTPFTNLTAADLQARLNEYQNLGTKGFTDKYGRSLTTGFYDPRTNIIANYLQDIRNQYQAGSKIGLES